jgi:hypothetical protein
MSGCVGCSHGRHASPTAARHRHRPGHHRPRRRRRRGRHLLPVGHARRRHAHRADAGRLCRHRPPHRRLRRPGLAGLQVRPKVQAKTLRWLDHWRFWTATGIPPDHIRFCRERRDKAIHCADLAITHFIDDRVDVLTHLVGLVPELFLFGKDWRDRAAPPWATPVFTWADAEAAVLGGGRGRPERRDRSATRDSARRRSGGRRRPWPRRAR